MKITIILCENILLYKNFSYNKQMCAGFPSLFAEVMCKPVRLTSKLNILWRSFQA